MQEKKEEIWPSPMTKAPTPTVQINFLNIDLILFVSEKER